MDFPWNELPGAIQALIIGAILNVVAVAVFSALPGGGLYIIMLGVIDAAALAGTVMHFLDWRPW